MPKHIELPASEMYLKLPKNRSLQVFPESIKDMSIVLRTSFKFWPSFPY